MVVVSYIYVEPERPLLSVPITIVDHKEDESWEFFSNSYLTKIKITSLEEAIDDDSSIEEIGDLPFGFSAERKTTNSKWIRYKKSERQWPPTRG